MPETIPTLPVIIWTFFTMFISGMFGAYWALRRYKKQRFLDIYFKDIEYILGSINFIEDCLNKISATNTSKHEEIAFDFSEHAAGKRVAIRKRLEKLRDINSGVVYKMPRKIDIALMTFLAAMVDKLVSFNLCDPHQERYYQNISVLRVYCKDFRTEITKHASKI